MIFAFVEDGTLRVFGTAAEAVREYEAIDVESGAVRFYDEDGGVLQPRFTTPNRRVRSAAYELVPNPGADEDPIALALYETQSLWPNPWFQSLEQLKATLAAKGVAVELRAEETQPRVPRS